jgi:transcriptional regulator with XRE-family HTH domain
MTQTLAYAALAEKLDRALADLPADLAAKRERTGMSLREAALDSGVSHTQLFRAEKGGNLELPNLRLALAWLGRADSTSTEGGHRG